MRLYYVGYITMKTTKKVDVLSEIVDWSQSRPEWQRDALRRLVVQERLAESDITELTDLCKGAHGLAPQLKAVPLGKQHIPARGAATGSVKLTSLIHHGGVNALAKDQMVEFGPALTLVYGGNASGKSGFTRILKRACRARGAEEILGNILIEAAAGRPSATIRFDVGDQKRELKWSDQATDDALGYVSVFDSQCAAVYLKEKTDVAFRPFGLDLFDRLSNLCEVIRQALEREQKEIQRSQEALPRLAEGTAAHKLISNITMLTNPDEVKKLATLSDAEKRRLTEVRKQLKDLQAEDPEKAARTLILRAQRLDSLISHVATLDKFLTDNRVNAVFEEREGVNNAQDAAEVIQAATFPPDLVTGTGSDLWRHVWEAARSFSTGEAYPDDEFPVIGGGARCVLCQQPIGKEASVRLKHFEEGIRSTAQQELDRRKKAYEEHVNHFSSVVVRNDVSLGALEDLRLEAEKLANEVEGSLESAKLRQQLVLSALLEGKTVPELPAYELSAREITQEAEALRDRAKQLQKSGAKEIRENLSRDLLELEARETLGQNQQKILNEIERKKKLAAYQVCLQETNTAAITRKSTDVTTRAVTEKLTSSFQDELRRLRFTHLEVEMQSVGGARGSLYHKLVLKRAPGADLQRVLSEGEARCLSIAAFFAELSTGSDQLAILFDDPVSSLDHDWRESVARRLVEESKTGQVIVFTHDIVFLISLVRLAEEVGTECKHQHLRRESLGAGVCSPELPWVAMKVKDRVGALRNLLQRAEKVNRTGSRVDYEREALMIYGLMREAWERGLEEVLLGGVVERYRPSIQTLRARYLSDITEEDCKALDAGMTKCSRWLPGHDQAAAENAGVPDPAELKIDIDALETWVTTISKRRK